MDPVLRVNAFWLHPAHSCKKAGAYLLSEQPVPLSAHGCLAAPTKHIPVSESAGTYQMVRTQTKSPDAVLLIQYSRNFPVCVSVK